MDYFVDKNNFIINSGIQSVLKKGNIGNIIPVVSIAIPTYKRIDFLKQALDSALNQKACLDYEIIIVDNDVSENNDNEKLLEQYSDERIFYYKNEKNLGMTGNWNRAIELARGKWVTLLHDDDILYPEFLASALQVIKDKDANLVTCKVDIAAEVKPRIEDEKYKQKYFKIHTSRCVLGNISPAPGILFKKELALKLGGFNDEFYPCADYVFWSKYCSLYNCYIINKKLAFYRIGGLGITSSIYNQISENAYAIKKFLFDRTKHPRLFKKFIIDVSMAQMIGGYRESYKDNAIGKEYVNNNFFYNNKFVFKFLCKIAYFLSRYV